MKYTKAEWAIILEERKMWDWSKSDSELARLHNVCRPCVQKLRVNLGLAPARTMRVRVALSPHVGELGAVAVPTDKKQIGIYGWFNTSNKKWYVGQSVDVFNRWGNHLRDLRLDRHFNVHLQDAFKAHGEAAFEFRLLEECQKEVLDEKEREWIAKTRSNEREYGYNYESGGSTWKHIAEETMRKIRDARRGYTHSEEARKKMSEMRKGRSLTEKQKSQLARLHERMNGFKHSEEARRNMSIAQKARPTTPAMLAHMKKLHDMARGKPSPLRGYKHSDETRMKQSIAARGRPSPMIGRKHSPETLLKLSISHQGPRPWRVGVKPSNEVRAKMSEAQKRRFAKEKQECAT